MHPTTRFALSILIAACGDSSSSRPDAGPDIDAPPDAPPVQGTAISVETDIAPSLIAYRDGAGAWTPAKMIDADTFELDVHGPYVVTVACDDGAGNIVTWQVARTPDDDRELFMPCSAAPPASLALTGTMVQAGRVAAGFGSDQGTTADWSFDIAVDAGLVDVFAFDANQIVARRGITVTADTQVTPALDLTQGTALVAIPLTATSAGAAETVSSTINITTPNATIVRLFRGAAAQTKVVPAAFLRPNERQSAAVVATSAAGSRTLRRGSFRPGDPTSFELPSGLGAVAYALPASGLQVLWTALPVHDIVDIAIDAFSEDFTTFFFHDLEISEAYIKATGAKDMILDTDIPGYKPAWRIDFTKEYFRTVSAIDFRVGETATSSISEGVNAPQAVRPRVANRRAFRDRRELRD